MPKIQGNERDRVRREKMRAAGLRSRLIWVLDTRPAGFLAECERQCRLVRAHADALKISDDGEWAEASDVSGWSH